MGFYVLVQPEEDAEASLVEHAQGHPSLVVDVPATAQITVQLAGRQDAAELAIGFARNLSRAATAFADRVDALTANWPNLNFADLAAKVGTDARGAARSARRAARADGRRGVVRRERARRTGTAGVIGRAVEALTSFVVVYAGIVAWRRFTARRAEPPTHQKNDR